MVGTIRFSEPRVPKGDFMKKLIATILLCCLTTVAFAQAESAGSVAGMIKDDLFANEARIKMASTNLNQAQKLMLYGEYKKDQWVPFLLNFVVGAGIGSFIQGDKTGGTIALVGDLAGISAVVIGATSYANAVYSDPYTTKGLGLTTFGYIALLGMRIFELVRPFTFTARYNSTLKGALNYFDSMSLAPTIENGIAGLTLSYKLRFN